MKTVLLLAISLLATWERADAQDARIDTTFNDYNGYIAEITQVYLKQLSAAPIGVIIDSAEKLRPELFTDQIALLPAKSKKMTPEAIYDAGKESVFILGMLERRQKDSAVQVRFSRISTAFAIAEEGVCVTNYHVLKGLIHPENDQDAVYFIATEDKQIYFIEKILGFSRNNDLAVFRVNTNGRKLKPVPIGKVAPVGAAVYCISHPFFNFYYFSAGMVARNVAIPAKDVVDGYDPEGSRPIRMEISADFAVGSSGGPVLDQCGNLIGIVSATANIGPFKSDSGDQVLGYQQMVLKKTIPVKALTDLVKK